RFSRDWSSDVCSSDLGLLGRVIDGAGEPLDGRGPLYLDDHVRLTGTPMNPLLREPIERTLDVGIRAINSLLTVGRGQRLGLFAEIGRASCREGVEVCA